MNVECSHCHYSWEYGGTGNYYATCPRCRYKTRIRSTDSTQPDSNSQEKESSNYFDLVDRTLKKHGYERESLIEILLELQKSMGWLPQEMLSQVSKYLDVPYSQVYQIATFYKAFSLNPRGKHLIRVCSGTSCSLTGNKAILDLLEKKLGIKNNETTGDGRFSLETVNCLGWCGLGPMITIDGEYYGRMGIAHLESLLGVYDEG